LNKVKAELTSRSLRKEIADLDDKITEIERQKIQINQKLMSLRTESTGFSLFPGSLTTTYNKLSQLEVDKLITKETWLNDHIYIDACGVHNLNEKEES
jgi:hypothetical protein